MQMNILKILNARRVTVGLSEGVTVERLISLLNERKVKVLGAELRNGLTGELLIRCLQSSFSALSGRLR
jgi:hypothetical protein